MSLLLTEKGIRVEEVTVAVELRRCYLTDNLCRIKEIKSVISLCKTEPRQIQNYELA